MGEAKAFRAAAKPGVWRMWVSTPQSLKNAVAGVSVAMMALSCTMLLTASVSGFIQATPVAALGLVLLLSFVVTLLAWGTVGEGRNRASVIFDDPEMEQTRVEFASWSTSAMSVGSAVFGGMSALMATLILSPASSKLAGLLNRTDLVAQSTATVLALAALEFIAWHLLLRTAQEELARDYSKGAPGYEEQGLRIVKAPTGYRMQYVSEEAKHRALTGRSDFDERESLLMMYIVSRTRESKEVASKGVMDLSEQRRFLLPRQDRERIVHATEAILLEANSAFATAQTQALAQNVPRAEADRRARDAARAVAERLTPLLGEAKAKGTGLKERHTATSNLVRRLVLMAEISHLEEELKKEEALRAARTKPRDKPS